MLHQLAPADFARARPLFGGDHAHLAIASALAGESPADLYVDGPQEPRAGLLLLWNGRLFLTGEPGDGPFARALAPLLRERYTLQAREGEPVYCAIAYDPAGWEVYLPALLSDIESARTEHEYYEWRLTAPVVPPALPADFRLRPVDAALVADASLGHHEALLNETQSEAPSVAAFLAHRFGYCIQRGDDLVAWCLSEYNHGARCELGIETQQPYQRRGLGRTVALATIAHAQRAGITTIGWHCRKQNLPSSALARHLGFAKVSDHSVWVCQFTQPPANT